ncbi:MULTISPECIES: flagellar hook-associated protein FlgL [unclassified Caballeronia]|uniref:flagellar hook-associated protein FlgL n=1 Tax=unclassified Caballeronia TaxID=2646786 RepID=UPI0028636210|nr:MULTISPECIES: flagellar hook-associated protein FlgL [unclassified Caballeronia]MDR5752007.1 flagellar hook-associated protein FlgL [Caballeronia sp. LZ024]MDR5843852.1 flagellar hook-associated protein FlgL [Caballeronia sp. LZ031]
MRISSSQYFTMNVQTMSDQQSSLASMYAQISSGNRLQTSSDDPLGAAQAVQLTIKTAALSQYATNQSTALSSLQQEDSTLSSVSDVLQSIQTQIVRAGDASLNDANRSSIADQIKGYRDQLMNLANTTDSSGNYIFAGFKSGSAAFTDNASGVGATYAGDLGQRQVQVNDGRTINVGDTGASVFQSVSPTESTPVSAAGSANKGSGTISSVSVTDTSNAANAKSYTISFAVSSSDGSTTYTVSPSPDGSPVTPVAYTGKTDITLGGEKVTLDGTPSDGDTFSVGPAASSGTDIFATLDNLVNALKQPTGTEAQKASLSNALTTASTKIDNSFNNVLSVQATVGGREQEVTATQTSMQTTATQTASNLADLTSINLVSAISQYELTQNALQGAQMAFSQIQKMSLFDYISG